MSKNYHTLQKRYFTGGMFFNSFIFFEEGKWCLKKAGDEEGAPETFNAYIITTKYFVEDTKNTILLLYFRRN